MSDMPERPPMGRLDTIDIGAKKMTIQTEFFPRPAWRIETKVYLGGALKKVYTEDLSAESAETLQQIIDRFHDERMKQIVAGLKTLK
jgi:hypothetical protein